MSDFRSPTYPSSPETPPTVPVVSPKKKSGNLTNILLIGAAFIAIGGIAFAGGRATAPAAASTGFPSGFAPTGSFAPGAFPGGGALGGGNASLTISGTVKSIDGTTMTITTASGTETVVDTSSSTYHTKSAATASEVQADSPVQVTVAGLGGLRPDASGGPLPSGAPDTGTGTTPLQATDVTLTPAQ